MKKLDTLRNNKKARNTVAATSNSRFDNLSDIEIAKMLAELSISYLKYPILEARGEMEEQ